MFPRVPQFKVKRLRLVLFYIAFLVSRFQVCKWNLTPAAPSSWRSSPVELGFYEEERAFKICMGQAVRGRRRQSRVWGWISWLFRNCSQSSDRTALISTTTCEHLGECCRQFLERLSGCPNFRTALPSVSILGRSSFPTAVLLRVRLTEESWPVGTSTLFRGYVISNTDW